MWQFNSWICHKTQTFKVDAFEDNTSSWVIHTTDSTFSQLLFVNWTAVTCKLTRLEPTCTKGRSYEPPNNSALVHFWTAVDSPDHISNRCFCFATFFNFYHLKSLFLWNLKTHDFLWILFFKYVIRFWTLKIVRCPKMFLFCLVFMLRFVFLFSLYTVYISIRFKSLHFKSSMKPFKSKKVIYLKLKMSSSASSNWGFLPSTVDHQHQQVTVTPEVFLSGRKHAHGQKYQIKHSLWDQWEEKQLKLKVGSFYFKGLMMHLLQTLTGVKSTKIKEFKERGGLDLRLVSARFHDGVLFLLVFFNSCLSRFLFLCGCFHAFRTFFFLQSLTFAHQPLMNAEENMFRKINKIVLKPWYFFQK